MTQSIAFIGVGNMGCPMAENLMKAGKSLKVFDVSEKMLEFAKNKNLETVSNLDELITADVETPLGKMALQIYDQFCKEGNETKDFSAISKVIGGNAWDYPID